MTIKCNRNYMTTGTPSFGGFWAVAPERIKVLRRDNHHQGEWYIVRFDDGGKLCMHESRIDAQVPA